MVAAKHIGIVACSAEGAALCYRTICSEAAALMGEHAHPELSMHTHPLSDYMQCIYRDDWEGVGELMLSSAEKLASIGADFVICPDNTIHKALPYIQNRLPVPWLSIAAVVASEAARRGFRTVGLTGTKYLVESDVYPRELSEREIGYIRPDASDRDAINRIILDELVYGIVTQDAERTFQDIIGKLKSDGCDAVVLGCTEIPLLMHDGNSPLPTLDSTRLLARAALHRALS